MLKNNSQQPSTELTIPDPSKKVSNQPSSHPARQPNQLLYLLPHLLIHWFAIYFCQVWDCFLKKKIMKCKCVQVCVFGRSLARSGPGLFNFSMHKSQAQCAACCWMRHLWCCHFCFHIKEKSLIFLGQYFAWLGFALFRLFLVAFLAVLLGSWHSIQTNLSHSLASSLPLLSLTL